MISKSVVFFGWVIGGTLTTGCAYSALQMNDATGGTSFGGSSSSGGREGSSQGGLSGTSGGAKSIGGALATGGNAGTGGVSSLAVSSTGGVVGGDANSGGSKATGGTPSTGGIVGIGGTTNAGTQATGGAIGTGGSSSPGGASGIGGTQATGGIKATGGTSSTGGTKATGGIPGTGGTTPVGCTGPVGVSKQSCQSLSPTLCQGESCCTSINVNAGSFPMGRGTLSNATDYYLPGIDDELPEHAATVESFGLDKYEVTVGRFRQYLLAYDNWHKTCGNPLVGAGAIPNITNTGWGESWTTSAADLDANSQYVTYYIMNCGAPTYSDFDTTHDAYPVNCISWYQAFAFCLWDGGWLPTEAQWEYAAAGGGGVGGNLLYPWGNATPTHSLANYYDSNCPTCPNSPLVPVGSTPTGNARWGHADMAGSVWEWVFDRYSPTYYGTSGSPVSCSNCANTAYSSNSDGLRSDRGGDWDTDGDPGTFYLRAVVRDGSRATIVHPGLGIRCARPAQ